MPVISNEDNKVLDTVTIEDLVELYDREVQKIVKVRNHTNVSADIDGNGVHGSKDNHLADKKTSLK